MADGGHIGQLKPDPRNARRHNPRNVGMIADALGDVGAARSIVIDEDDTILAGNATIEAAAQAGIERLQIVEADGETIVAVRRRNLTPEQKRRLALFDNRAAELAEWDESVIAGLVEDTDLSGLFSDDELAGILAALDEPTTGLTDPDAVPDPPVEPITQPGDLWLLGRHRLFCGDATDDESVARLLDGVHVDATVTDPPYGVDIAYESFEDTERNVKALVERFMPTLADKYPIALTPGIPAMWFYPRPSWLLVWVHPAAAGSGPWGFAGTNPILVYGDDPYLQAGMGRRHDYLSLAADREGVEGHPVIKPIKVWSWLVERMTTRAGQVVYDPFLGSGTTLIAAEQLGRVCYGMEISPQYVDVCVQRWEQFTGQTATRETA